MKKLLTRLLCVILIVSLLLQVSVFATDTGMDPVQTPEAEQADTPEAPAETPEEPTEAPVEEPAEAPEEAPAEDPAELPEEAPEALPAPSDAVAIPQGWWYNALKFMVDKGFMQGTGNGLNHTGTATRAEMATMITRIVGLMDNPGKTDVSGADLSAYTDMWKAQWFYRYMAVAVRYAMFNGTSNTTLSPNTNITREQAFTVIGRIFGYGDGTKADLAGFSDGGSVGSYAVPYVGSLVKHGIVNGTSDNGRLLLNPQGQLTRAELAQVLYNLFSKTGTIYEGTGTLPTAGTILWACEQDGADFTVDGNLVLGGDCADVITLTNVTVTGTLTIAMRDNTQVNLVNCSIGKLNLQSQTAVTSDTQIADVQIFGAGNASYTGDAKKVTVSVDASLTGTIGTVNATCANLTIGAGSQITNLSLSCSGGVCTLDGNATNVEIKSRSYTLQGSGYAEKLLIHYKENKITCAYGTLKEEPDPGLTGTHMTLKATGNVNVLASSAKFTVTFSNVNLGYGSQNGSRACTLKWYVDGALKQSGTVRISEGGQSTFTYNYAAATTTQKSSTVKAVLSYEGQEVAASKTIAVDNGFYTATGPTISTFGGYQLSATARSKINAGINLITSRGYTVGFMLVDMTTGQGIAYNADRSIYMASAIKGPYVVSVMNMYPAAATTHYSTIQSITRVSSNEAYNALRNHFGHECMVPARVQQFHGTLHG